MKKMSDHLDAIEGPNAPPAVGSRMWNPAAMVSASNALRFAERLVFGVVGVLLFAAGLMLSFRALEVLHQLVVQPVGSTIRLTANFLELILLILMIAELAYTVSISLRGAVLSPQPFLIVGLIAVIRRILVITVQEVEGSPSPAATPWIWQNTAELAILALIVMAFVFAIYILQRVSVRAESSEFG